MPISFPFRRRRPLLRKQGPDREQLRSELNEAIAKLTEFSSVLRRELEVSNREEDRINPRKKPDTE